MAVRPTPKFNLDEMHLDLMFSNFDCTNQDQLAQAVIECVQHNDYQTDPAYLMQCLVELFDQNVVEQVKAHFGL